MSEVVIDEIYNFEETMKQVVYPMVVNKVPERIANTMNANIDLGDQINTR